MRRQVIELLAEVAARLPGFRLTLASFMPVHLIVGNREEIEGVRKALLARGIGLWVVPTIVPWPLPLPLVRWPSGRGPRPSPARHPALVLPLLLATVLPVLALALARGFRVFHCRSYPASVAALTLRLLAGRCRFIFDPRSDFPEENCTAGAWRRDSMAFGLWKWLESKLLAVADATVCPAYTYVTAFRERCPSARTELIPNNVDTDAFSFHESDRQASREAMGIDKESLVFCYVGEMAESSWHRPSSYARLVLELRSLEARHTFLFLVPETARGELIREMRKAGVDAGEFIVEHPGYSDVARLLSAADYGLMLLTDRKIAVGTKIVEYLACGLQILVNANCLGAVEMIQRYGVGQVFNVGLGDLDAAATSASEVRELAAGPSRSKLIEVARSHFSNEVVAARYARIYEHCIQPEDAHADIS